MTKAKKIAGIIILLVAISFIFRIEKVNAGTFEEWFNQNEQDFQERICESCQEDPKEEPEEEPEDEPEEPKEEPEEEPETEVEVEIEVEHEVIVVSRNDSKCKGSIGNLVWNDENENGVKDNGERGLDDIKIKLKWIGRDFKWNTDDDEELDTHTNSNGKYEFDDLCEGDYKIYVKERDIAGYTQVYDPDGDPNHKAKVYLDGDKDDHTKADFGYKKRTTPATGAGAIALVVTAVLSFFSIRQLKKVLY